MFKQKIRFTYDEIRVLVFALNELRNSLIAEGRYVSGKPQVPTN